MPAHDLLDIKPPLPRLRFFKDQLGISPELAAPLANYAPRFAARVDSMGEFLYQLIMGYAQTKIVLQHQTSETRLKHNWRGWYARLWDDPLSDDFLAALWKSGTRHVQYGVDHRFISLAYSHVRRFCMAEAAKIVPAEELPGVTDALARIFDLCLLVETDAFLTSSSRCELDVMAGVAHQIRNPLTIIGGNAHALLRSSGPGSREHTAGEAIIDEARRLERMVRNVSVYVSTLSLEPKFRRIQLEPLLTGLLDRLRSEGAMNGYDVDIRLPEGALAVEGDPALLEPLFYHLLQNAAEAALPDDPRLSVTSGTDRALPGFLSVHVFNTGQPPPGMSGEAMFLPFHSSKPYGTGFGLAIARLAARRNFGTLDIAPVNGSGTEAVATLPLPGAVDASGLFVRTGEQERPS